IGITRAVIANMSQGAVAQGGSTLTQQLVKNLFLNADRTYERKAREALLAVSLESVRTKDEILELYLNEIYLGQVGAAAIAGIDQAARIYFGKSAERLTLGEAATLAGIISAPNRYSPLRHPERALARRDLALRRMAERGWITAAQSEEAKALPLQLAPTSTGRKSPWLVAAALERIESEVGEDGVISGQGWTVRTTLQPALQRIAEDVVVESLADLEAHHPRVGGAEMALVALRASDGAVLAMVGGRDFGETQFNRVTSGARQIGSTVKPLTYLAAINDDHSRSPGAMIADAPLERTVNGQPWAPKNYDGTFRGEMSMRRALADSRNIPAVRLAESVGMSRLSSFWKQAGLSQATAYPSSSLGSFEATPLELAGAYTVFPNLGEVVSPKFVVDAQNSAGEIQFREAERREAIASPEAAWLVTSMLAEVMETGTGRAARLHGLDGAAAGKTGTTDDARDAWFVGFTGDVVVAVWVGFDRGKDLGLTGGKAALPAWARFVDAAGLKTSLPEPPEGLELIDWCADEFRPARCAAGCADLRQEWVFEGETADCPASNPLRDAFSRLLGAAIEDDDASDDSDDPPRRRLFPRRR
ncbi:MAG: PBP1A family penicillin-binding protein, partial [Myxococcota bacterium]